MIMKAYGAEIVLTDGAKGMSGAIEKAEQLSKKIKDSFIPGQFENPANPAAHRKTTGPEIWEDTDGNVDIFVAGVGTGGTITGVGEYLKEKNPRIKIVAVEPDSSPLLSGGKAGSHNLQGIGANFIPQILNTEIYDEAVSYTHLDVYKRQEMKLAALCIIIHPLLILAFSAIAVAVPAGTAGITNPGFHGLSQVLYEFASSAANNGSGFEGLADNSYFWNITTGTVSYTHLDVYKRQPMYNSEELFKLNHERELRFAEGGASIVGSCTPYLNGWILTRGETFMTTESSNVLFSNSVFGAAGNCLLYTSRCV